MMAVLVLVIGVIVLAANDGDGAVVVAGRARTRPV
jgi:hypothetical protein